MTVAVQCGALSDPENGYVEVSSTVYLSIAQYGCFEGYELNGQSIVRCEDDGNWSSDPPICIGKAAANPLAVEVKDFKPFKLMHFILLPSFSLFVFPLLSFVLCRLPLSYL